jgi:hypothetical protein
MESEFKWYDYVLGLGVIMLAGVPVWFLMAYQDPHPNEAPTWLATVFLIWCYGSMIWLLKTTKKEAYRSGLEAGHRGVPLELIREATLEEREQHNRARQFFELPPIPDDQSVPMAYDLILGRWMAPTIGSK